MNIIDTIKEKYNKVENTINGLEVEAACLYNSFKEEVEDYTERYFRIGDVYLSSGGSKFKVIGEKVTVYRDLEFYISLCFLNLDYSPRRSDLMAAKKWYSEITPSLFNKMYASSRGIRYMPFGSFLEKACTERCFENVDLSRSINIPDIKFVYSPKGVNLFTLGKGTQCALDKMESKS